MIRLSYILPIYNVERYLAECLDSIYSQSLDESDFEVICVDDCTPDNSLDIIEDYQSKHTNLVLVRHEVNKKAGGARNTGVKAAKGKYIWFVDPDDYISKKAASIVLNYCDKYDLDSFCFNLIIKETDREYSEVVFHTTSSVEDGASFLINQFGKSIIYNLGYPVRCIYKREILVNNNITFPEKILYGEETTFMAEVILASERVLCIPDALYYYRQNNSSASAQLFERMQGILIYQSIFVAGALVFRLQKLAINESEILSQNILLGIPWFVNRLFMRLVKTSHKERVNFYLALKDSNSYYSCIFNCVNKIYPNDLYAYMNAKNNFIVKHHFMGLICLDIVSFFYKIKHLGK